jgi:hypothetical protein
MNNPSTLRSAVFAGGFIATVVFAAGCSNSASRLIQNSEAKSPAGWTIKVLDSSQPATVNIKERSPFGGTQPEKATSPTANQSWLQVTAELTPPGSTSALPVKQIKLVDGSNSYPALAMTRAPEKGEPSFVYFKDSTGLAQINAEGQLLWAIMNNQATGETELLFQKSGAEKVLFLFAVPSAAKSLTLQIS